MELFNFLLALCFLILGAAITAYLAWVMVAPLVAIWRGGGLPGRDLLKGRGTASAAPRKKAVRSFGKLRKAAARVEKADALIADHKCQEALKQLRKAVVLDVLSTEERVQAIKEHHQNFLSRCLLLAEEMNSRAENIAEVERLFIERSELQMLLCRANESFTSLQNRREQAGKNVPSWSKTDFEQRIKDIRKELQRNETALSEALKKLYAALAQPVSENIVYH
jgi:hypothetical protein